MYLYIYLVLWRKSKPQFVYISDTMCNFGNILIITRTYTIFILPMFWFFYQERQFIHISLKNFRILGLRDFSLHIRFWTDLKNFHGYQHYEDTNIGNILIITITYFLRSSRKAWLKITIFAIHSPFLLPSFFMREEKRGKEKPKMWF